jgi:hypothetical protein
MTYSFPSTSLKLENALPFKLRPLSSGYFGNLATHLRINGSAPFLSRKFALFGSIFIFFNKLFFHFKQSMSGLFILQLDNSQFFMPPTGKGLYAAF